MLMVVLVAGGIGAIQTVEGAPFPAESMLTAATTTRGENGTAWVYVGWSPVTPSVLKGRVFGMYRKPGTPEEAGGFERVGTVGTERVEEARVIEWVRTGMELGDRDNALGAALEALVPAPEVSAGVGAVGKLRAVLTLAASEGDASRALEVLAARFHAVRFALGRAWAGRMAVGPTTIEVREVDGVTGVDRWVVARVSLEAGSPRGLPTPGAPEIVRGRSGADDLRVGLVWAEPDALRRRSPLVAGFDVWRVSAVRARALGWEARPPTPVELAAEAERVTEDRVMPRVHLTEAEARAVAADPAQAFLWDTGPTAVDWKDGDEYAWFVAAVDALGNPGAVSAAGFGFVCGWGVSGLARAVRAENHFFSEEGNPVRQVVRLRWEVVDTGGPRAQRFEVYRGTGELPQVSGENVLAQGTRVGVVDWDGDSSRIEWSDNSVDPASDPSKIGKGYWYAIRSVRDAACGRIASAFTPPVFVNVRQYVAPDAPTGSLGIDCPRVGLRRAEAGFVRETLDAVSPLESKYRVTVRRRDAGVAWVEVTLRVEAAGVEPWLLESPRLRYGEGDERVVYDVAMPRGMGPEGKLVGQVVAGSFAGAISEPLAINWVGEPGEGERWAIPCEAASLTLSELPGVGPWEGLGAVGPFPLVDAARAGGGMVVATSPDSGATVLVEAQATGATEAEPWRKLSLTRPVVLPGIAGPKLYFADPLLPEGSLPNLVRYRAWILPPPRLGSDGGCAHVARPAGSRRVEPIHVQLVSPAGAAQWRVYRRLDDGPMTLVAEGLCPKDGAGLAGVVEAMDDGMPVGAARLCYFGQVADAHGNWSPLGPLGCEDVVPAELPVPLLGEPRWEGDAAHPVAVLRWFCSVEGVNRFRIVVKPLTGPVPTQGGTAQTAKLGTAILALKRPNAWFGLVAASMAGSSTEVSTEFETGPIGNAPVGEGPEFAYPLDVEAGITYEVRVAAVDARGHAGHASYARRLVWKVEPESVDRVVPWPQRPGVPVGKVHPAMTAVVLATNRLFWPGARDVTPVGVRVGSIPLALRESSEEVLEAGLGNSQGYRLRFATMRRAVTLGLDVETFLFTDTLSVPKRPGFRSLGVVLYREQVANDAYPEVSGDLVQVSSCLRRLAQRVYRKKDGVEQEDWVEFLDPMVGLALEERPNEVGPLAARRVDIHLLDLHPVVRGARYRYWLVHQDASGEPDWTMPAGEVEVPR